MSRLTQDSAIDRLTDPKEQARFISMFFDQLTRMLNSGLNFADNFDAKIVTATFSTSNTDTSISHGLNRIPTGYIALSQSAAMSVYDGSSAWSASAIVLRSSAAGSARLFVF